MTNQELLRSFETWATKNNIAKGVMTLENTNFGIMPREAVEQLVNLTVAENEWLSQINTMRRTASTGTVPILDLNRNISEGVGENEATGVDAEADTRNVPYACKKFKARWYISTDDIQEAAADGIDNFEEEMSKAFAKALGNDISNVVLNGNITLNDLTSMNRLLRMVNGLRVKCDSANVIDGAGKAFSKALFTAMEDNLPARYSSDPNLKWIVPRRVMTHYKNAAQQLATQLGDKALVSVFDPNPNGIPPIVCPQLSPEMGPAAIAPTSAADGTTYITFVLTTLVTAEHVASVAAGVGRKFKVTCIATGESEICTGVDNTTLDIVTLGLLGQTTVSTDASAYTVGLVDETEAYLGNPKGVNVVMCNDIRSYKEFEANEDRFRMITYFKLDTLIPNPAAFVKAKRIGVTPISTW